MKKYYEEPNVTLIVMEHTDVLTASGAFWTNEPDWEEDPFENGGFDAEDQFVGDFWEIP